MKKRMYIVRGAPASGKTTLTPLIARYVDQPVALIEQDNWRWGIHLVGRSIKDIGVDEHKFADSILIKTLEEYLAINKYTIIIEGAFSWDDPSVTHLTALHFLQMAKKYDYDFTSIVLTADKNTLLKRNTKRKYTVPDIEFNLLFSAIYNKINENEYVLDSSNMTKGQALKKLRKNLNI